MYSDKLYGDCQMPDFISELANTPEVQRINNISQDVLPRGLMPWAMASRFEHSMGVLRLGMEVLKHNANIADRGNLLLVSALLHDVGNPALSHLSEPFLKELTGKDGESFLEETIERSETASIVHALGLSSRDVVNMVTGNLTPFSKVLNGSMDIDNLDNVNRYWFTINGRVRFDGLRIASLLKFNGTEWVITDDRRESKKWQDTREAVYGVIYGSPHQNACMMVYRAVAIAFERGELTEQFFRVDDTEAMHFLTRCNEKTSYLARQVLAHNFYPEVLNLETIEPSDKLQLICKRWNARHEVADHIAKQIGISREAICVYVGKGRDRRRIDLPFVIGGREFRDEGEHLPIYRFRVYVDHQYYSKVIRWKIQKVTKKILT